VWSLTGATSGAGNKTGTSMATPQVAALATYVWSLKPSLTPQEVLDLLLKTSRTPTDDKDCGIAPQPVIDAYAAVLATDNNSVLDWATGNPFDAPARLAIMDVADSAGDPGENDAFDHYDLKKFIYELTTNAGLNLDYSRHDLNGDEYTGGTDKTARFNLDIDSAFQYTNVNWDIDGEEVSFDEKAVSDWDVLCYYAYSPLYTGDNAMRDTLLTPYKLNCGASPDTSSILFIKYVGFFPPVRTIFSMNSSGGSVTQLTNESAYIGVFDPSWSPDQLKVVYVHGGSGNKDIWVMDRDGSNQTNITNDLTYPNDPDDTDRDDADPQWSPDGSKILFSRSRGNGSIGSMGSWIYVMDADGSNMKKLTPDTVTAVEGSPAWSPDGTKIAFWSYRGGNDTELYVMNADGSNQVRLTEDEGVGACCGPLYNNSPAWSPGGSKIYFKTNRDLRADNTRNLEIYSMNADGSGQQNLTNSTENEGAFSIAPEGSKIVFERDVVDGSYVYDLFVMSIDGTNQVNITNNEDIDDNPVWSPDSTEITFGNGTDMFVVNSDGSNLRNITNNAEGGYPEDWK